MKAVVPIAIVVALVLAGFQFAAQAGAFGGLVLIGCVALAAGAYVAFFWFLSPPPSRGPDARGGLPASPDGSQGRPLP